MERGAELELQGLVEELQLGSLDDSDFDAVLAAGSDAAADSDISGGASLGETASSDSIFSSEVRAALGEGTQQFVGPEVESQLRLRISPPGSPEAGAAVARRRLALEGFERRLAEERAANARALAEVQSDVAARVASLAQVSAMPETQLLREQLRDLTISDAAYQELRRKPEKDRDLREFILVRFHESMTGHKAQIEELHREVDALRENVTGTQCRAERSERALAKQEARAIDLREELDKQEREAKVRVEILKGELATKEQAVSELRAKGDEYDALHSKERHVREELEGTKANLASQTNTLNQLNKERDGLTERLHHLDAERSMLIRDAEGRERQIRVFEESLHRKDTEMEELREKVASLRQKKKDLAQKTEAEQQNTAAQVRDKVDSEIQRFQSQAQADLEAVKRSLTELHEREVAILRETVETKDRRVDDLQRRLDDEEHAHQELQISHSRVRGELQNEITELRGHLKLRAFEGERAGIAFEEESEARQKFEAENATLRQQVELLKKEYYELEIKHKEDQAGERAELLALREQLRSYREMEGELDAAIRGIADDAALTEAPKSIEEALLLGTTLAGAPAAAQRRIQQSLVLAQELQRRTRELVETRQALRQEQERNTQLSEYVDDARRAQTSGSEPQAYILEALRRKEREVLELQRDLSVSRSEIERLQQQVEKAAAARQEVEEDLKRVLAQRRNLEALRSLLSGAESGEKEDERLTTQLEQRPRLQPQQRGLQGNVHAREASTGEGGSGPSWYQKLNRQNRAIHVSAA